MSRADDRIPSPTGQDHEPVSCPIVTEKAVGKHVASIFGKLDLPVAADDNRRVLAVLAWLGV